MTARSNTMRTVSSIRDLFVLSGVGVLTIAGHAVGQDQPADQSTEKRDPAWIPDPRNDDGRGPKGVSVSLELGGRYAGESDFDSVGGTFESTSFNGAVGFLIPIDDQGRLLVSLDFGLTEYDITPDAGVVGTNAATVGAQFDTVTEVGVSGIYSRAIDSEKSFFVGGSVGFAGEGDLDDALTWGAMGGMSFQVNPDLKLGLGVGVFSRHEDDPRIIPLPQIEWAIDEKWTLKSERAALMLDYQWNDAMSMGVMASFDGQSFRIDEDNTLLSEGSASISQIPISYYIDYTMGEQSRMSLFAQVGVTVAGNIEMFNANGDRVVDEDIDPGVFLSGGISFRF